MTTVANFVDVINNSKASHESGVKNRQLTGIEIRHECALG